MCKLAACVGKPFSLKTIENFYNRFSSSNPHAAGYALYHDNSVLLGKQPGYGTALFARDKNLIAKTLPQTSVGLFHVRFATHGSPSDNKNNHPILHSLNGKVKSMIIHNGMVSTDKNLPTEGKTDTEQILSYWDQEGPECLAKFSGNAAIVVMDCGKIYVYHHRAPLYYQETDEGIYFHQDHRMHDKNVPENIVFEVNTLSLVPVLSVSMKSLLEMPYLTCSSSRQSPFVRANDFWNSYQDDEDGDGEKIEEEESWEELCKRYGLSGQGMMGEE